MVAQDQSDPDLDGPAPLLVLGPSLGTSVAALWGEVAAELAGDFRVLGFDLPGHGESPALEPGESAGLDELAAAVVAGVDAQVRGESEGGSGGNFHVESVRFHYAGDSIGGAIGLQLALDHPDRLLSVTAIATGATISTPQAWADRAALVRGEDGDGDGDGDGDADQTGTRALLADTPGRWFSPTSGIDAGLREQLLGDLAAADDASYAALCEGLAAHDVRSRLAEIVVPLLAVAGADDVATPPASLRHVADGVQYGDLVTLPGVAHLPPAEQPAETARLIRAHANGNNHTPRTEPRATPRADPRAAGMRVRREVLSDAHVDRASAGVTDLTADFQQFITRYAWGEIWTRPGLDRRSRSLITLTALIARGHHEEFAMHVRAARRNGLSADEIGELILQTAIYLGVPDANTAYRIAQQVLDEEQTQQ